MFVYRPHFLPSSIVVIGAGGTGARLMPMLTQLIRTCLRRFNPLALLETCNIYVIDGDVVEDKNLSRQNFIASDIGKNKALVVAERYARAYGVPVIPCMQFLRPDTRETFEGPTGEVNFSTVFANAVVIFAVDSAKARKEILQFMNRFCTANLFVIDAGNEDDFGQIKTFTGHFLSNEQGYSPSTYLHGLPANNLPSSIETYFIPFDFEYYRNLGESAQERSCADLPQTLAINNMMSALILSTLQNFMYMKPMNYDGMSYGMKGGMSTSLNTPRSWASRVITPERSGRWAKDVESFLQFSHRGPGSTFGGGPVKIQAGTAMYTTGDENGDIFFKLRAQAVKDYAKAGMILQTDGTLKSAAPPPPPPAPPAPKLVAKEEIPAAPQLISTGTVTTPVDLDTIEAVVPATPAISDLIRLRRQAEAEMHRPVRAG